MSLRFFVDWDGDNVYDGVHDDVTADVMRAEWFIGARSGYQSVCDEPTLELELRNTDGKYSPENATSPLFGKMRPSLRMRVWDDTNGGTELWNGFLQAPRIEWEAMGTFTGRHTVTLVGVGAKNYLERTDVSLPLFTDTPTHTIIIQTLVETGVYLVATNSWIWDDPIFGVWDQTTFWDFVLANVGTFDEGITILPTYGDATINALAIIQEVTASERGRFYIARDGRYVFENRHNLYLRRDPDHTINSATKFVSAEYAFAEDIINVARVTASPRRVESIETLWALDSPITIPVGEAKTFEARLRRANGQFAGTGSLSASPTFSTGSGSVTTIVRGGVCTVSIANTGSGVAILTGLTLQGAPQYAQNLTNVSAVDAGSVALNGRLETTVDAGVTSDFDDALAIGQMELARRGKVRGEILSFVMRSVWGEPNNDELFKDIQIGKILQLEFDELGHDKKYYVVGERHVWQGGGEHELEVFLEPMLLPEAFILDISELDVDALMY